MYITETVRDLENYPAKSKTVTLDLQKVMPADTEGDEVYVITSTPGVGISKIGGGTINPIFVRDYKAGFFKSSGKINPPFTVTSGVNTFNISIDGSPSVAIILTSGTGLTGEAIASDMQTQINALAASGTVSGNLSFLNATAEFVNNSFLITAGSISNTYVGVGRSSVAITGGTTNDISVLLGLDKGTSSERLSSQRPLETVLTSSYTTGTSLAVGATSDFAAGQAFTITDGANREYFVASGIASSSITLHYALTNSYASGSVIQRIFERDPNEAVTPYNSIDDIVKFALRSITNQIDFSK